MLSKKGRLMRSPEIIGQITNFRRKEREAITRIRSLQSRDPQEVAEEQADADRICREMRLDCEGLLNAHGTVKRPNFFISLFKGKVLETSIVDDGSPIELDLLSFNKESATKSSEIIILIQEYRPYLNLLRDHGEIWIQQFCIGRGGSRQAASKKFERRANLQDARQWKEIVAAIKEQRR